jgi:hypothetical protein
VVQRIGVSAGFRGWKLPTSRPSERRIAVPYAMPVRCQVWLRISESQSASGPQVSMLASLALSAIHVLMIHRASPDVSGSKPDEIALALPLVPANERIVRPWRTFRAPAGGSWMSLQLFDHERAPLSEEHDLGACSDGMCEASLPMVARVHPATWLSIRGERDGPEPKLRLDGELGFVSGIGVRLRMRSLARGQADPGPIDVPLTSVGTTLHFVDRHVERNVPGLPAILLAFLDADGRQIGHERLAHMPEA